MHFPGFIIICTEHIIHFADFGTVYTCLIPVRYLQKTWQKSIQTCFSHYSWDSNRATHQSHSMLKLIKYCVKVALIPVRLLWSWNHRVVTSRSSLRPFLMFDLHIRIIYFTIQIMLFLEKKNNRLQSAL